jgi:general secretion pathway protein A
MSSPTGPESFYGLSGRPFSLSPNPAFFFGSKVHMRALAYLEYGVYNAEGFIVVTGEVGSGKTTLIRKLFRSLDSAKVVAVQLVSTQLEGEDTLRMVLAAFGLSPTSKSKAILLMRFEEFLRVCDEQGKRVLLMVDEAQNLADSALEELRMLSNFQTDDRSLIQTFLVGQPEFRATINSARMTALRQRVIASCHLPALDASDTRGYIEHRLQFVGWKADPWFDDEAFERIHAFTGGVPRRINTLCDRLMLMGFIDGKHSFGGPEVQEVIAEIQLEMPTSTPRRGRRGGDGPLGLAPSASLRPARETGADDDDQTTPRERSGT